VKLPNAFTHRLKQLNFLLVEKTSNNFLHFFTIFKLNLIAGKFIFGRRN